MTEYLTIRNTGAVWLKPCSLHGEKVSEAWLCAAVNIEASGNRDTWLYTGHGPMTSFGVDMHTEKCFGEFTQRTKENHLRLCLVSKIYIINIAFNMTHCHKLCFSHTISSTCEIYFGFLADLIPQTLNSALNLMIFKNCLHFIISRPIIAQYPSAKTRSNNSTYKHGWRNLRV